MKTYLSATDILSDCTVQLTMFEVGTYRKPTEVKELERLADAYDRDHNPDKPKNELPRNYFRDDTANGLTRCIVFFIRLQGGQSERINTTGIPIETTRREIGADGAARTVHGVRWRKGTGTTGSADISAIVKGRAVKIEVKIGSDRQSKAQKQYQKEVEDAGGLYFIARNFKGFLQWYKDNFEKGE